MVIFDQVILSNTNNLTIAQSAGTVEYTDWIFAVG